MSPEQARGPNCLAVIHREVFFREIRNHAFFLLTSEKENGSLGRQNMVNRCEQLSKSSQGKP